MPQTLETLVVKLEGDARQFSDSLDNAKGKTSAFSSMASGALMGVGMAAANMAVSAASSLVGFASDGIAMASDLGETMSKVGVVFGDWAGDIEDFSKNAATSLGMTQNEAAGAAATFGNLFVSMGLGKRDTTEMSTGLVSLAADLASFNNMDPAEALDKLKAGMLGSAEPMQSLGVNMTAATTTAKALEMGLAGTAKELTPAMLAQARYAIILEQTATAQGDFARTSEGLANQQRIADAQWKELQTTLGTALLPVMTAVTSALNKLLTEVLPPLAAFIKDVVTPTFKGIADAVGPAIEFVRAAFTQLGTTMQGQADGPMAYLKKWFDENMPRIQAIVENVTAALTGFWRDHGEQIMAIVMPVLNWLVDFWTNNMETVLDVVTIALQLLTGDFEGAGETLKGILDRWYTFFHDTIIKITDGIQEWFNDVDWGAIGRNILEGIADGLRSGAGYIGEVARDAAEEAKNSFLNLWGIHSPSKVAANEIGLPFAQGIAVGINDGLRGLSSQVAGSLDAMTGSLAGGLAPAGAGAGAGGIGSLSLVQNFYGPTDTAGVKTAAQDGVLDALRSRGVR